MGRRDWRWALLSGFSSYINAIPNGTNFLERLTAVGKTFNVPVSCEWKPGGDRRDGDIAGDGQHSAMPACEFDGSVVGDWRGLRERRWRMWNCEQRDGNAGGNVLRQWDNSERR